MTTSWGHLVFHLLPVKWDSSASIFKTGDVNQKVSAMKLYVKIQGGWSISCSTLVKYLRLLYPNENDLKHIYTIHM